MGGIGFDRRAASFRRGHRRKIVELESNLEQNKAKAALVEKKEPPAPISMPDETPKSIP